MLIEQPIDLRKAKTENLKVRTDTRYQVMDDLSVKQYMILYKGRLLEKAANRKSKYGLKC